MALKQAVNDLAVDFGFVEDRAGRYARQMTWERRKAFVVSSWKRLLLVVIVGLVAVTFTFLLPSWARGFVAGAWLASVVWVLVVVVIQSSGTAGTAMGSIAERWTAQELRVLRDRGWKIVSHIMPTFGDIDHVAVGPGGLIVAETKWTSETHVLEDRQRIEGVIRSTESNARRIRLALQNRLAGAPVHVVVAYWGPRLLLEEQSARPVEVDGVTVLPGHFLKQWLDSISDTPRPVMSPEAITSAWETLNEIARHTDQRELGAKAGTQTTPLRQLVDAAVGLIVTMVTLVDAGVLLRWLGISIVVPVLAVAGGLGLLIRNVERSNSTWRIVGFGLFLGCVLSGVLLSALYGYSALAH